MSAKRKYRTPNEYLKYLKGELSREERYTFERDLQADPFEMDAIEGMELVPVGELEEDLLSLHANMHKRLKRRRRRTFYYAAASIASLLIVGTVFLNIYNINPKSAQETISNDETFLHEEVTEQDNVPVQEEISMDQSIREEAKELPAQIPVQAETPVPEEIIYQEEKALGAVEMVNDEAEAPVQEAEVPVSNADELVVMEAQPRRLQKKEIPQKSRAQEAPAQKSTERVSGMEKESDSGMVADLDEVVVIGTESDYKYSGAEPEGGLEAYKIYIEEQIRFPAGDTISKREVVVLKFNVESDGSISRINALRSPGNSFSEEAIRLVNDGPSWNPAKNENGPTDDVVRMRIVFRKQ